MLQINTPNHFFTSQPRKYIQRHNNMITMSTNKKNKVAILMGSRNDMTKMQGAIDALNIFNIESDIKVLSAHRQPTNVSEMATNARVNGYVAFICGDGMSANLASIVSAHTTLPVVGVPISSGTLNGLDALYSTVEIPKGVPIATVAIDGSYNAGMLVAQILGINDKKIADKIRHLRNVANVANDKC